MARSPTVHLSPPATSWPMVRRGHRIIGRAKEAASTAGTTATPVSSLPKRKRHPYVRAYSGFDHGAGAVRARAGGHSPISTGRANPCRPVAHRQSGFRCDTRNTVDLTRGRRATEMPIWQLERCMRCRPCSGRARHSDQAVGIWFGCDGPASRRRMMASPVIPKEQRGRHEIAPNESEYRVDCGVDGSGRGRRLVRG
jgi:hypothetical protein